MVGKILATAGLAGWLVRRLFKIVVLVKDKFSRVASALLNLSLGRRERGKEKKEGEKEKGREGEK